MKITKGHVMAAIGAVLILLNVLDLIFRWETNFITLGIIGIVFLIVGINFIKKKK
jgi:hypothetical protein